MYWIGQQVSWSPDERYLAFVRGGDTEGRLQRVDESPLTLALVDWRAQRPVQIPKAQTERDGFDWTPKGSLLYTSFDKSKGSEPFNLLLAEAKNSNFSSSKLLVAQAHSPISSSTGGRLAFWGFEKSSSKTRKKKSVPVLRVADSTGRKIKEISSFAGRKPLVFWGSDDKHLYTLLRGGEEMEGHVVEWNIATGSKRNVGVFKTLTYKENGEEVMAPFYQPLGLHREKLFCSLSVMTGAAEDYYLTKQSLQGMNLIDGTVKVVASNTGVSPFDWHGQGKF